jgi:hypothetical protein
MIKFVMGAIMVTVLFSRALIPVYPAKLGVTDATVNVLKSASFGIMAFALLMGASIILGAVFRGRCAERQLSAQEVLEEVNT